MISFLLTPLWGTILRTTAVVLLGAAVFGFFVPNLIVGYIIYAMHLKRTKPSKWSRECSDPKDPSQLAMYRGGLAWYETVKDKKRDVRILNEGLNLCGEFFDFGSKTTAVMIPGRTEGLRYMYYFAKPYSDLGYNLLCIDQRAHGESDGKYNTVGFEEHKDLLAWVHFLQRECHTETVIFHGICIGSACGLYAITSPHCPDAVKGMVAEGMYPTFWETFKNHMIELKKPLSGLPYINGWMKVLTGHTMKYGPAHVIDKLQKPLLMIHSKEDLYSRPEEAQKIYDNCGAQQKRLVWFEHGKHSHLRITDPERYDGAVKDFWTEVLEEKKLAEIK